VGEAADMGWRRGEDSGNGPRKSPKGWAGTWRDVFV
jgi:hypothetical protein